MMSRQSFSSLTPEQIGQAIKAFRAKWCPACGIEKDLQLEPFCDNCLGLLSPDVRDEVCDNSRYISGFHKAMAQLQALRGSAAASDNRQEERRQPHSR